MSAQLAHAHRRRPRTPLLKIDLEAVAANTRLLAGRANGALMAVVKADGFGHGAVPVARTALANGATSLGVTSLDEALELRDAGLVAPVLSWLNTPDADYTTAIRRDVQVAVPGPEHLAAVAAAARLSGAVADIHLHADTGMARDGAAPEDWLRLCVLAREAQTRGRVRVVGLMGHLGSADDPADPANVAGRRAFGRFNRIARACGLRPVTRHLAATAATLTAPRSHHDLCRVGAGLVGIDPTGTTPLSGAMTVTAPVVSVRQVPAGTPVGYGRTFVTSRPSALALVPVGYADGMPRAASGRAEVLVACRRRPVVGRISMDQLVVDVTGLQVRPDDPVIVLGPGARGEPTTADWATWSGTLPHEIVTGFGARLARTIHPATTSHLRSLT
ncbi:alanine racemase [Aeromicrobium sp. NPDC092404]|uniref:alanine racemase n=1 Tax=Aeromicrobium sp. NPDC092404 TaxID=3154976 RepID=UPI003425927A